MLINHNNNEFTHVKFVSYTGRWPNLCSGVLTLEIDVNKIPEQFRKYATEINEVFNDNVPWGCCGGCI